MVTVFNKRQYIGKCLEQIIRLYKETNGHIECIVVNDGSVDDSLAVINRAIEGHSFCFLIDQSNKGVSSARNTGMSKAKGRYIAFVDGDDIIDFKVLANVLRVVSKEKLLAPVISINSELGSKGVFKPELEKKKPISLVKSGWWRSSVCGVLYPKKLIQYNQIRFVEGLSNGEDTIFTLETLLGIEECYLNRSEWYKVNKVPSSLSRSWSLSKSIDMLSEASNQLDYYKGDRGQKLIRFRAIYSLISNAVVGLSQCEWKDKRFQELYQEVMIKLPFNKQFLGKQIALLGNGRLLRLKYLK